MSKENNEAEGGRERATNVYLPANMEFHSAHTRGTAALISPKH